VAGNPFMELLQFAVQDICLHLLNVVQYTPFPIPNEGSSSHFSIVRGGRIIFFPHGISFSWATAWAGSQPIHPDHLQARTIVKDLNSWYC